MYLFLLNLQSSVVVCLFGDMGEHPVVNDWVGEAGVDSRKVASGATQAPGHHAD